MAKDISEMTEGQLRETVESVLASPAVAQMLGEITGKGGGEGQPPAISPEMLAKMPEMMRMLAPMLGRSGAAEAKEDKNTGEKPASADKGEQRRKLLAALRPYLSEQRRDALDGMLRAAEMSDLLGGISQTGKK